MLLQRQMIFRYTSGQDARVNAPFTNISDLGSPNEGLSMSMRRDIRAIGRAAARPMPGAALILGGLLLLISP
jgi:hypothetical protein